MSEAEARKRVGELAAAAGLDGDVERTRTLLEAGADATDLSALALTIEHGRAECLGLLLEHGADANDVRLRGAPLHAVMDLCYRKLPTHCSEDCSFDKIGIVRKLRKPFGCRLAVLLQPLEITDDKWIS